MDDASVVAGLKPFALITPESCQGCHFSHMEGSDRVCRRFPPQLTFIAVPVQRKTLQGVGTAMEIRNFTGYPIMQHDQWCGEWTLKRK